MSGTAGILAGRRLGMPEPPQEDLPMKRLFATTALCLALATPAYADGKIYVQLPDLTSYRGAEAETFLTELVMANIVSSNCAGYEVTDEEWSLLTDSADLIAYGQLGLTVDDTDTVYYGPAFAALDQPDTCAEYGPKVEPMLQQLVDLGGARTALPDQDAAYAAHQVLQAEWDARAGQGPVGKTKTK
ncbi:hypothetical protein [Devosia sp. SL43]|uniref:hypothetical protein n=1 Tax=Devosia sp. SL43 TaxID=2806348 RepID=UPI001F2B9BBA|nr:hypothetical protein [Devosia sp. SL43]UJW84092.1 hypothetical protein IM737_11575 [Devosia sp. SL43]